MILAWHVNSMNGAPYPVLWYGSIPSESASACKYLVKQQTKLTEEQEEEIWNQPDGTRTDFAAKKYPYIDPDPVDTEAKTVILIEVTTAAV